MDQLCAPARGSFSQIVLFEQEHIEPAAGAVECAAHAGYAAADHDDVPRFGTGADAANVCVPVHLRSR